MKHSSQPPGPEAQAGGLSAMSGGRTRIPRLNDSSNPPDAEPMFSLR